MRWLQWIDVPDERQHRGAQFPPVQFLAARGLSASLFKMHRQGLAWGTAGSRALCGPYIMPILKKSQYRIQMTKPDRDGKR